MFLKIRKVKFMESLIVVNFVLIIVSYISVNFFENRNNGLKKQVPRKWIQDLRT